MVCYLFAVWLMATTFFLRAEGGEQENHMVVRLSTENSLTPLYLAKIEGGKSSFEASYLENLNQILLFDLNHNGMTVCVPQTAEKEKIVHGIGAKGEKEWKTLNVFYAIKIHINENQKLSVDVFSRNQQDFKHAEGFPLSGQLGQDRCQIHLLADTLHKALFGKDGIAITHVLYTVRKKNSEGKLISDIWEADYDGGNAHQVIHDNGYNITPSYVPPKPGHTSGSFFYVSYQSAQPKIFVASVKEKRGRRFNLLRGNQLMPTVSRQRDKVAFISDVTGNPDLFIQPFDPEVGAIGVPQQIYAGLKATQGTPTFSPDGKKIAFVSDKDGSPRIYMIDVPAPGTSLKDTKAELLTKHAKESSAPAWSPDGLKIAYCAKTNSTRQIWVLDLATREERQLTQGAGNKENPTWAPNSLHLIYNSSDAGACELYLVNLNQTGSTKISSGIGEKRFPSWESR